VRIVQTLLCKRMQRRRLHDSKTSSVLRKKSLLSTAGQLHLAQRMIRRGACARAYVQCQQLSAMACLAAL